MTISGRLALLLTASVVGATLTAATTSAASAAPTRTPDAARSHHQRRGRHGHPQLRREGRRRARRDAPTAACGPRPWSASPATTSRGSTPRAGPTGRAGATPSRPRSRTAAPTSSASRRPLRAGCGRPTARRVLVASRSTRTSPTRSTSAPPRPATPTCRPTATASPARPPRSGTAPGRAARPPGAPASTARRGARATTASSTTPARSGCSAQGFGNLSSATSTRRTVAWAVLEQRATQRRFFVANTHLDSNVSDAYRITQMKQALSVVAKYRVYGGVDPADLRARRPQLVALHRGQDGGGRPHLRRLRRRGRQRPQPAGQRQRRLVPAPAAEGDRASPGRRTR